MTKEHRVPFPSVIGRGPTRVRSKASILTTEGAARARVFSLVPSPKNGEQIGGNATGKETSSISQRFPPFPGRGRGLQVWREENILFEKKLYTKQLSKSRLSTRHPSFPLGVSSFILHCDCDIVARILLLPRRSEPSCKQMPVRSAPPSHCDDNGDGVMREYVTRPPTM